MRPFNYPMVNMEPDLERYGRKRRFPIGPLVIAILFALMVLGYFLT
tara:strand:+ start:1060 stop:1197 length:138 start_codon:yes stop_codon:yes gene_type:complete